MRASGLRAIDPNMDFGDSRNLQNMTQLIEQYRSKIDAYNTAISVIDSSRTEMEELDKALKDITEIMLIGVAFKYGKDSRKYEMAGAVRKSDACGGLRLRNRKISAGRSQVSKEEISSNNPKTP